MQAPMLTFRRLRPADLVVTGLCIFLALLGGGLAWLELQGRYLPLGPITAANAPIMSLALFCISFAIPSIVWPSIRLLYLPQTSLSLSRGAGTIVLVIKLMAYGIVVLCLTAIALELSGHERDQGVSVLVLVAAVLNAASFFSWIAVTAVGM
jgi:hypothetical protein